MDNAALMTELDDLLRLDDDEQGPLLPPPLAVDQVPDGEDELGQKVIDGSQTDDDVDLPDLSEEGAGIESHMEILDSGRDPSVVGQDPFESEMTEAFEESDLVFQTDQAVDKIDRIHDRVKMNGVIARTDMQQVLDVAPGVESGMMDLRFFTEKPSKVYLEAGLNSMEHAKKGLIGLGLAAGVGLIIKLIMMAIKAVRGRMVMTPEQYKEFMVTPDELSKIQEKLDADVAKAVSKVQNLEKFKTDLKQAAAEKYKMSNWQPRQLDKMDDVFMDHLFIKQKIKKHLYLYDAIAENKPVTRDGLQQFFNKFAPFLLKELATLDTTISELAQEIDRDDLNPEKFDMSKVKVSGDFGLPSRAQDLKEAIGEVNAYCEQLLRTNPDGKLKGVKVYAERSLDVSATVELGKKQVAVLGKILARAKNMQVTAEKIDDSLSPEIRRAKLAAINHMVEYLTSLQKALNHFIDLRNAICNLNKQIQDTWSETQKFFLAVVIHQQKLPKNP